MRHPKGGSAPLRDLPRELAPAKPALELAMRWDMMKQGVVQ